MRRQLAAMGWIGLALAAAAYAGCRWPIPSCEDEPTRSRIDSRWVALNTPRLEPLDGGAFRIGPRTYGACTEWCAELPGVVDVVSCEPPTGVARFDGGLVEFGFVCEVEVVACRRPVLVGRIR